MINGRFTIISSHCFGNYMTIFHKTEVQTAILRCLTGLKLDWFKSYDSKWNISISVFLWYCRKKCICVFCIFWVLFVFCVITVVQMMIQTCLAPQNDSLNLSFVKDINTVGKKMTRNGTTAAIYKFSSISEQSIFRNVLLVSSNRQKKNMLIMLTSPLISNKKLFNKIMCLYLFNWTTI